MNAIPWDQILIAANIVLWTVILTYVVRVLQAKQQTLRRRARLLLLALGVATLTTGLLARDGWSEREAMLAGAFLALCLLLFAPKRPRRIPKGVRRQVIAKFEVETGERYDPKLHHLDHIVPFSRGGDHSERNLRVIPKRKNLRKGARMPGLRDFD